ncbi:MAG: bacteriocin [Bacilli bacterium]|nr:bacteriocin [Bacilli bacterium]
MKNKKENPNLKSEELNEEELATISGGGDPGHRRIEPRLPNEEPKGKGPGKMPA